MRMLLDGSTTLDLIVEVVDQYEEDFNNIRILDSLLVNF